MTEDDLNRNFLVTFEQGTKLTTESTEPIETTEAVNHPNHYQGKTTEVIKVIEDYDLNFCLGNVIKYLLRAGRKDKDKYLEDLRKASWYLDREISTKEQENP